MNAGHRARRLLRELARQGGRVLPADSWAGDRARRLLAPFIPDVPAAPAELRARVAVDHFLLDPRAVLTFPAPGAPALSIAVLLNGRLQCAYRCLEALLAHGGDDYELIVIDRGACAGAGALLGRLRNAVVIETDARASVSAAWNAGAARARAPALLLLDSCWAPGAGALSALRAAMAAEPDCGAVTGPLVRADGTLLEAGAIVWRDGAIERYGHRGDVREPQFSYVREVDSGSPALQLVRADVLQQLGGFDEAMAPDADLLGADLAMAVWRLGHRVVYAPRATAFHCGHAGSGSPPALRRAEASGAFVAKWRRELDGQPERRHVSVLRARDRGRGARVLVVDDRIPDPGRGAGYPRAHALITMLASLGYRLTLFPYQDRTPDQPWLHDLQQAGVEVIADDVPFVDFAAARSGLYDAVIVSRPPNFREVRAPVRRHFPRAALIYDAEAVFFVRDKLKAELAGEPWSDDGAEREERTLLSQADLVLSVSEHDKQVMGGGMPQLEGRIRTWSHPVAARPTTTAFRDRGDLLFVGGFQASPSPNEDAVRWFVREVLPRVRARLDCRLRVVGFRAPAALADVAGDGVDVLGHEEDLTAHYESCRVFVVPHLYAAGIPLKLCESMARGIPAVVTGLMARQLGVEPGREVLVGNTPGELADRIVELYQSEPLWTALRETGLDFIRRRHDPATLRADLDAIVSTAIAASGGTTIGNA